MVDPPVFPAAINLILDLILKTALNFFISRLYNMRQERVQAPMQNQPKSIPDNTLFFCGIQILFYGIAGNAKLFSHEKACLNYYQCHQRGAASRCCSVRPGAIPWWRIHF
jgi:hypothetical protein